MNFGIAASVFLTTLGFNPLAKWTAAVWIGVFFAKPILLGLTHTLPWRRAPVAGLIVGFTGMATFYLATIAVSMIEGQFSAPTGLGATLLAIFYYVFLNLLMAAAETTVLIRGYHATSKTAWMIVLILNLIGFFPGLISATNFPSH